MADIILAEDNSDLVKKAAEAAIKRALEIVGGKAESYAKEELNRVVYSTPEGWYRRTGALRNSISHRVDDHTAVVYSGISYAPYVELGTGKEYSPPPEWMEVHAERGSGQDRWFYQDAEGNWHVGYPQKGRPFLRPAIENHLDEYNKIIENELRKG